MGIKIGPRSPADVMGDVCSTDLNSRFAVCGFNLWPFTNTFQYIYIYIFFYYAPILPKIMPSFVNYTYSDSVTGPVPKKKNRKHPSWY